MNNLITILSAKTVVVILHELYFWNKLTSYDFQFIVLFLYTLTLIKIIMQIFYINQIESGTDCASTKCVKLLYRLFS